MSSVIGQTHNVNASSDRQIIAFLQEIDDAESNGDVRILTGSCRKIAVFAHVQYKFGQNSAERPARRWSACCNAFVIATYF